jgi:hypothetical protein
MCEGETNKVTDSRNARLQNKNRPGGILSQSICDYVPGSSTLGKLFRPHNKQEKKSCLPK